MNNFRSFIPNTVYRVVKDPSVLPLAEVTPVFKPGELVRFVDLLPAVKEGYTLLTFEMLDRAPGEFLRMRIFDNDPTPEPDWRQYFAQV